MEKLREPFFYSTFSSVCFFFGSRCISHFIVALNIEQTLLRQPVAKDLTCSPVDKHTHVQLKTENPHSGSQSSCFQFMTKEWSNIDK